MLVGIVGKSGSGKSFIAKSLEEKIDNSIWIDVDKVGHMSLNDNKIKAALINRFGLSILNDDRIDRKKLSDIVFNSEKELAFLNQLTELYIKDKIAQVINNNPNKIIILDWALLTETRFFELCDIKILVQSSKDLRAERVIKRDNVDISKFEAREKASYSYDNLNFDFVLKNNEQLDIQRMVNKIYEKSYICR